MTYERQRNKHTEKNNRKKKNRQRKPSKLNFELHSSIRSLFGSKISSNYTKYSSFPIKRLGRYFKFGSGIPGVYLRTAFFLNLLSWFIVALPSRYGKCWSTQDGLLEVCPKSVQLHCPGAFLRKQARTLRPEKKFAINIWTLNATVILCQVFFLWAFINNKAAFCSSMSHRCGE